jgi:predicted dehydrogenase
VYKRQHGSRGAVTWDGGGDYRAEALAVADEPSAEQGGPLIRTLRPIDVPSIAPLAHSGHAGVIAEVLDAIEAGRDPETVGHDNRHSVAMVCGAVESAETHQRVSLMPARAAANS